MGILGHIKIMLLLRSLFRFSAKVGEKLATPLAEDLTAIVRQTSNSTIYRSQPNNETLNMREIVER